MKLLPATPPAQPDAKAVPVVTEPGPLDGNPVAVYLAGKPSAVGRRGLEHSLNRAAEIFTGGLTTDARAVDWTEVRYQHVMALRAALHEKGAKPATINHILAAVRGTLREAWRLELIDAETLARAVDVKNVSASTLPAGRHVDVGEVRRLFEFCSASDTPAGARDAALLTLLYGCGMRRSEAVALLLADYDAGALTVRFGKGRKERIVYAPAGGREAIAAWLARRGSWPGALLCPVVKGGHVQQRAMTTQAVMLRLWWMAKKLHLPRFSPHDLRRSFVGALLDAGADISSVQQLAGHSNVATTQKYDRRPEEAKRRTAELLYIPYVAPVMLVGDNPPDAGEAPPSAAPAAAPEPGDPAPAGEPG